MAYSKKTPKKLAAILLYSYLLVFPFGQLLRFEVTSYGLKFVILPTDVIALLSSLFVFYFNIRKPKVYKYISVFILVSIFSLLLSLVSLSLKEVVFGSLYLLRFVAYSAFFVMVWNLIVNKQIKEKRIINYLIGLSLSVSIVGLMQYWLFPDARFLYKFGWDDHLHRLISSLLDPTYTGIIITFGALLSLLKYFNGTKYKYLTISILMSVSVLLTYSRASYLSLIVGITSILFLRKKLRFLVLLLVIMTLVISGLPRPDGEGVKLERVFSIESRFENYDETLLIIEKQPLFGIGFNNLCIVRKKVIGGSLFSHACAGSDSSLLLVLATTGIVGFVSYMFTGYHILRNVLDSRYFEQFYSISASLLIHSFFANTLFYPFVMGYLGILLAVSIKE